MGAVIDLKTGAPLAERAAKPLPDWKRDAAARSMATLRPLVEALEQGLADAEAMELFVALTGKSAATGRRFVARWRSEGRDALLPKLRGRVRKTYGWEARAQHLFAQPQRPAMSTVAYWLRQEGFASATDSRVTRYLKALPSNQAETAPSRVGRHYYAQNIRPHVHRDASVLAVGECYEGDGHTCDVYVQHPATGNPFRPELTAWLDVRSQRVAGWWLGEMENSFDVLYALSAAIREHDHVPTLLHTDPGSGYINKMLADEATGMYARLSITPVTTLPGNARGKGLTEGWFRWFEERCGKSFPSFCGHCRTDDELSRLRDRIRRGEIVLPSFLQYRDAVAAFMDAYNANPKETLQGQCPNDVWGGLVRNPLSLSFEVLYRPQKKNVAVRKWEVRLFNRCYRAAELAAHEKRKVTVEYDIHDDTRVWVRDAKGAFVCEALLVEKKPWISESVLSDRRLRAADGQRKRLERHLDEVNARAKLPITAAAMIDALDGDGEDRDAKPYMPAIADRHTAPRPAQRPARPKPVSDRMRRLVEDLEADVSAREEQESAEARFARALELDAMPADEIGEENARWLSIYRTSAEYAARKLIHDEGAGDGAPAPSLNSPEHPVGGAFGRGDL